MRTGAFLFPSPAQKALSVVSQSECTAEEHEEEQHLLPKLLQH